MTQLIVECLCSLGSFLEEVASKPACLLLLVCRSAAALLILLLLLLSAYK